MEFPLYLEMKRFRLEICTDDSICRRIIVYFRSSGVSLTEFLTSNLAIGVEVDKNVDVVWDVRLLGPSPNFFSISVLIFFFTMKIIKISTPTNVNKIYQKANIQ